MRKAVDKIMRFVSALLGLFLAIAVILVFVQVIFRYLIRSPLGWTDQLCRFLYVWIVMLGLPVLFHAKSVTVFDSLSNKLGAKQQVLLHLLVSMLSVFFSVCFFIFSWQFMLKKGTQMIPAFRVVPYYAIYASMPICAIFLCLEMTLQCVESVAQFKKMKGVR